MFATADMPKHLERFFLSIWEKFKRDDKANLSTCPLQSLPWDSWELDHKFFKALSQWTLTHPDSTLDKILDDVCAALESGTSNSVMQLIPDSPFPARSLIQALTYVLRLGITISTAKVAVQKFSKEIVRWNDGRWSSIRHGLSIPKEIEEFQTRITDARALFLDLSVIETAKGMDKILEEIECVRRIQQDQLQGIHDKLDAQDEARAQEEQARARKEFLTRMLITVANPSYIHQGKLPCDEDTRAEILTEIKEWIKDNSNTSQGFLWLSGDPGSGKSAITASIARDCDNDGTLWAQFFINRNSVETTDPNLYFPSIARQFIDHSSHPDVATFLHDAIKNRPMLVDEISSVQVSKLFVDVLELACRVDPSKPVVVVIDGLDETSHSKLADTAEIFSQIFKSLSGRNAKVLISSRTDDDIRRPFASMMHAEHVKHIHLDTSAPASIRDVSIYLARRIGDIVERHDLNWAHWPGQSRMEMLCDRASGLFIWAVTVTKFFQDQIGLLGTECLDDLLDTFSHKGMGDINALYSVILQIAYRNVDEPWIFETFRRIIGCIVTIQKPLAIATISSLLDLRRNPTARPVDIVNFCRRLRTVLVSGVDAITGETIPRLHKSFFEFITSTIDTRFRVNLRYSNSELAFKSIRQLIALAHEHSINQIALDGSRKLRYAMQFWAAHLRAAANFSHGLCLVSDDPDPTEDKLENLLHLTDGTHINPISILISSKRTVISSGKQLWGRQQKAQPLLFSPNAAPTNCNCLAFAFSPDGQTAAFSVGRSIYVWEVRTGHTMLPWKGHTTPAGALAFSPDGKRLVSGGSDGTLIVWDTQRGDKLIKQHWDGYITSVAFSPDGFVICDRSTINLCNHTLDLKAKLTSIPHSGAVALSPDGEIVVFAEVWKVCVWNLKNGTQLHSLQLSQKASRAAFTVFSPLGRHFVSFDTTNIFLWDAETGALVREFERTEELMEPKAHIRRAAFSPDGNVLVGVNSDCVCLWNVRTGLLVSKRFPNLNDGAEDAAYAVAFTLDGKHIMSGGMNGAVRMWEVPPYTVNATSISSTVITSSTILSASFEDNIIRHWDVDSFLPLDVSLVGNTSQGFSILAISSDERRIAALSTAHLVSLWDAGTRELVCPPMTPSIQGVYSSLSLLFSLDNLRLTLASPDQASCSWSAMDGSPLSTPQSFSVPAMETEPEEEWFDFENGWGGPRDSRSSPNMRFRRFHGEGDLWACADEMLIRSNGAGSLTILPLNKVALASASSAVKFQSQ
ncbi:hypothetical protein HWV62_39120 [Athelia sp. TMB]|nr:hypothetical protein HWV62_39120 [Athelia sp. TMB]